MAQVQEVVTKDYRASLDKLAIGESLYVPATARVTVRTIVSSRFHETTDKRFTIIKQGAPEGQLEVKRVDPIQEVA